VAVDLVDRVAEHRLLVCVKGSDQALRVVGLADQQSMERE
jgi:hypothetical protein